MEYIELELLPVSLASKKEFMLMACSNTVCPPAGFVSAEGDSVSAVVFVLLMSERSFFFAEIFKCLDCLSVSLLGSHEIPEVRLGDVLSDTDTVFEHTPDIELRIGISLLRGLVPPFERLADVFLYRVSSFASSNSSPFFFVSKYSWYFSRTVSNAAHAPARISFNRACVSLSTARRS